ncbi:MAG: peptide chain release factor N(5)-glutamine methyltransferase [Nitrospirae bacterium]|nr:peptide chain release factor N(5)-glutamine methyltransferase [Nitrospirota bacterium]
MRNNKKIWTIKLILKWASEYLSSQKITDAYMEAEYLLTHALDCSRKEILLDPDKVLSNEEVVRFNDFIYRRGRREPAHYIIGEVEFRGLIFKVNKDVLIPRPETELLVEEAVNIVNKYECDAPSPHLENSLPFKGRVRVGMGLTLNNLTILDLCTGSGCIAISIAKEIPVSRVYAVDISDGAVKIAQENAKRNGVDDKITFLTGDLYKAIEPLGLEGKVDLLVSNPPYVSKLEMAELQPEIKNYEPLLALYGGEDGLDFYRRIIREAPRYLSSGGFLIMELGYGEAEGVRSLIENEKFFRGIETIKDLAGIDRVIKAG